MNLEHAQILAMFGLGGGSLFSGLIPLCFVPRNHAPRPLLFSILLCIGAGVLLSTTMVHMLPEVKHSLPKTAEIIICVGFLLLYFIDEIIHLICGEATNHNHNVQQQRVHEHRHSDAHQTSLSNGSSSCNHHREKHNNLSLSHRSSYEATETCHLLNEFRRPPPFNPDLIVEHNTAGEVDGRLCHVNHLEPCNQSKAGHIGLLSALSLHAVLEGLAIGVQNTVPRLLMLTGAVASHKLVVGFCIGNELASSRNVSRCWHIIAIVVFSLGSVIGIACGMAVADEEVFSGMKLALPVLQGIATGTLLYVTLSEILPRERARWHENNTCKSAGFLQFLAVVTGFAVMSVLTFYLET